MGRRHRVTALFAIAAAVVALSPPERAWACSCAEQTVDEILERDPQAAVVRVRRIDEDGGASGVGHVEEVLHGPEMPAQLPLALDDGGSCLPWVAVSDVAVLTFVPDGGGWRTLECGRLAPTTGLDPVVADPSAAGPVAAVVAGSFPGAGIVALDDHLRVLATGDLDGVGPQLQACGEDLLTSTVGANGGTSLVLLGLPGLEPLDERPLSTDAESEVQVLGASCDAGRVDVLTAAWGGDLRRLELRQDVFGDDRSVELPAAEDAAFVGGDVLLLEHAPSGDGAELARYEVATGTTRTLLALDGITGYEVSVAPDGEHALVRGSADEPLLLVVELDAEREVARSTGWWQPVARPWLGAARILQVDEDAGGVGDTGLAEYRVVDLRLTAVAALEPTPAWNTAAADHGIVQVDGGRITVLDGSGAPIRSTAQPWSAGAHDAVLLGAVTPGGEVHAADLPAADPAVARAATMDHFAAAARTAVTSFGPLIGATAAALAALSVTVVLLARRRRRRREASPGT